MSSKAPECAVSLPAQLVQNINPHLELNFEDASCEIELLCFNLKFKNNIPPLGSGFKQSIEIKSVFT